MLILVLVTIGFCMGSFINALVWRLHAQEQTHTHKKDLSILQGRSMCAHCAHPLAWYDLVPFFSWLSLKGRCRYCKAKIDDNPLVEIVTPALFVVSYIAWPYALAGNEWYIFGFWLVLLTGLIALAVYDLRWMELPNRIVYPLLLLCLIFAVLRVTWLGAGSDALRGATLGALCLGGLFLSLFYASRGKWIGGGDVKLGFVLGTWIGGPMASFLLLFIASLCGSLFALSLLLAKPKQKNTRIAFGPFLVAGTIITTLAGPYIIAKYFSLIGL